MKWFATVIGSIVLAGLAFGTSGAAHAAAAPVCGLNNGKPAAGAPIPIGSVVSKTGPADFSTSAQAAAAYFKCVNENGGINGRPIDFKMADDGWNPDQSAQAAARLIKDDKVLALVGNTSIIDCAVNQGLYEAEDVVVIAGVGVARECFFAKNYAPTNQGPRLSDLAPAIYANKTWGSKKIVCIAANAPGSEWGCNGIRDWGKDKGIELHVILFNPDGLDATSTILEAMSYKPDVIDILMIEPFAVAMFQAAEQQGLGDKVHWIGAASLYNASIPPAIGKYWNDKLYVGLEFQPLENNGPDNQNWLAVLAKYAAADVRHDTFSQSGYLGARILTEALLKLDPAKIDRKTVTAALRAVKGFKSDILCAPWYFGPGIHHNANHVGVVDQVDNGGFKTVDKCFNVEDPETADLTKLEAEQHLTE